MAHVKLKASKEFPIDFHPNDLNNIDIPLESKEKMNKYLSNRNLSDQEDDDIMLMFENRVIFGFDYIHERTKRIMIEINPITIFYANSVMSYKPLKYYKEILIEQSKDVNNWGRKSEPINLSHSSMFFQLAINCIINLQATLESFANAVIPLNYPYLDKNGKPTARTVKYKINVAIPRTKGFSFQQNKNRKYNNAIDKLIEIRNDIIHLKPESGTNTSYKNIYRELLIFDYTKTILSVKTFINFYEPNLLEECECGKDLYFYSGEENQ